MFSAEEKKKSKLFPPKSSHQNQSYRSDKAKISHSKYINQSVLR